MDWTVLYSKVALNEHKIIHHSNSRQVKVIGKGYHMPNTRKEDISDLPSTRKRTISGKED